MPASYPPADSYPPEEIDLPYTYTTRLMNAGYCTILLLSGRADQIRIDLLRKHCLYSYHLKGPTCFTLWLRASPKKPASIPGGSWIPVSIDRICPARLHSRISLLYFHVSAFNHLFYLPPPIEKRRLPASLIILLRNPQNSQHWTSY